MCAALVRAGALDGLSIGFRAARARPDGSGRLRVLTEVELWEVSIVTFPMLPGARISAVTPLPLREREVARRASGGRVRDLSGLSIAAG
jgi:phage head maturation protease